MPLGPIRKDTPVQDGAGIGKERKKSPLVTFIAVGLGVTMVLIGVIMTFWGLAWQSNLEETDPLDENVAFGSPLLIPLGLLFVGFGIMWVWLGYHGFPRREDYDKKRCPHCNREIEKDLNFCYWCNSRLDDTADDDIGVSHEPRKARRLNRLR